MCAERLYPIAPSLGESGEWVQWVNYFPGLTPNGEQVIVFASGRVMYAYRFDPAGRYLGQQNRAMSDRAAAGPPTVPPPDPWAEYLERAQVRRVEILAWIDELGLRSAIIHIRKFHSGFDGPLMEIRDQPSHFEDGDMGSEEDREATLRWWRELGAFVLFWNTTEYKLDGNGEPCG